MASISGAEEFLGLVALAEFVDVGEVVDAICPILGIVGEFFAAVTTDVDMGDVVRGCQLAVGVVRVVRDGRRRMEGTFVVVAEGGAGPRMTSEVKGILVSFGFIFVFEAI